MIIPALYSKKGSLINLGLRTLEFWCDNLHPDYLHPIFATQDNDGVGHCTLMVGLTQHLQPAPYPFGLLCMRLLGKLGGANRLFLREMIVYVDPKGQGEEMETGKSSERGALSMYCEWESGYYSDDVPRCAFLLPLPLSRAVDVLRYVSTAPSIYLRDSSNSECDSWRSSTKSSTRINFSQLLAIDTRTLDLDLYSVQTIEAIKHNQSKSAFIVIRAALASVIDVDEDFRNEKIPFCTKSQETETNDELLDATSNLEDGGYDPTSQRCKIFSHDFKLICDGLFAASAHEFLEEEAMILLKGLGSHIVYLLITHRANITRIDRDGCPIDPYHQKFMGQSEKDATDGSQYHISEKIQHLKSFGTYRLSGPLEESDIDPFTFNEALADAFAGATLRKTRNTATVVVNHLIELFRHIMKRRDKISPEGERIAQTVEEIHTEEDLPPSTIGSPTEMIDAISKTSTWGDVLFENLLSTLCRSCFNQPWNLRTGIMAGLFNLITKMGLSWSEQYEVEILHTAMFIVKDTPDGIAHASEESVQFFLQVSWFFFGGPSSWKESNAMIYDVLCPTIDNPQIVNILDDEDNDSISVKEASLALILLEIASAKPLVR